MYETYLTETGAARQQLVLKDKGVLDGRAELRIV